MLKSTLIVSLSLCLVLSCGSKATSNLVKHESLYRNDFLNHSLLKRGDIVEIQVYKGDLMNDYFFRIQNDRFELTRDSLQFNLTDLLQYSKVDTASRKDYVESVEKIAWQLHTKMSEANVNSFTSEFRKFGVDLMINIKDHKLLYVPDTSKITNPEWIKFLNQSEKIKEGWYLYDMPD